MNAKGHSVKQAKPTPPRHLPRRRVVRIPGQTAPCSIDVVARSGRVKLVSQRSRGSEEPDLAHVHLGHLEGITRLIMG
jgi:hypothetical protein